MITTVTLTPDGLRAISTSWADNLIRIWNISTSKEVLTLDVHTDGVRGVAVTADGRWGISASKDHTLKVRALKTGDVLTSFSADRSLYACAVAPDGVTIMAGDGMGRVHFLKLIGLSDHG